MKPIFHNTDYVRNIREPKDIGVSSAREIARGINVNLDINSERNRHLWCYRIDAIEAVEHWLTELNVTINTNFKSFNNFENIYDYVEENNIGIRDVCAVMVYDIALCLGERMEPQVVPQESMCMIEVKKTII